MLVCSSNYLLSNVECFFLHKYNYMYTCTCITKLFSYMKPHVTNYRIAGMFRRVKVSFFEGGNDFCQFYFRSDTKPEF